MIPFSLSFITRKDKISTTDLLALLLGLPISIYKLTYNFDIQKSFVTIEYKIEHIQNSILSILILSNADIFYFHLIQHLVALYMYTIFAAAWDKQTQNKHLCAIWSTSWSHDKNKLKCVLFIVLKMLTIGIKHTFSFVWC